MDILQGLSVIPETRTISKELRQIDAKIPGAEFKAVSDEVIDGLLHAKEARQDANGNENEKEGRMSKLEALQARRGHFEDEQFSLFDSGENGVRNGRPCYSLFILRAVQLCRSHMAPSFPRSAPDPVVTITPWKALYRCHHSGGHDGRGLLEK